MGRGSRRGRILTAVLGAMLLGAGWFLLAPQMFGGSTAYVIVSGSSMQPGIDGGDLVLLRNAQDYRVGDVVGYRSPSLHTVVLHRIVHVDGGRFTFKGDSNSWIDPDRPSASDLLGRMWVRVPGVGSALRRPWVMFALVGVLLVGAFGGLGAGRSRRRRATLPARPAHPSTGRADPAAIWISTGLALAAAVALGGVAFTTSETRETAIRAPYAQSGSFTYAAAVPPGPVYGDGAVATGDPVYLRLAGELDVAFGYTFRSDVPHRTTGTGQLFLVISDVNGWSRRSALGPSATIANDGATLTGRLDLTAIHRLLVRVERLTGVVRDRYELRVVADVRAAVSGSGGTEQVAFAPGLAFQIDALELQLSPGGTALGEGGGMLHPTAEGSLEALAVRPAALSVLGRQLDVRTARLAAVAGAVVSLGVLVVAIALARRRRGEDEASLIHRRYGRILVPVRGPMTPASRQVEVADMDTLVRLAEHHECLILHGRTDSGHDFAVEHDGVRYRYGVGSASAAPTAASNGHSKIDPTLPAGPHRPAVVP
jgi:signal peptidase I